MILFSSFREAQEVCFLVPLSVILLGIIFIIPCVGSAFFSSQLLAVTIRMDNDPSTRSRVDLGIVAPSYLGVFTDLQGKWKIGFQAHDATDR